jgi:SAM-dependent methyltransferase
MSDNNTIRFSDRVADYVKYRPGYPTDILPYLQKEIGLDSQMRVADVGSGTGILTRLFLENRNNVYAVEPNDAMRKAAEAALGNDPGFHSVKGTAEQTTLAKGSMDVITAGQAFHWFDAGRTKKEFLRISGENAWAVLIWNERQVSTPFEKDYEGLLLQYATDYRKVDHRNVSPEKIGAFFAPRPVKYQTFPNEQVFDFNGLKGRLLSSSYMPNRDQPGFGSMIDALTQLYEKHSQGDHVILTYETRVYAGRLH